MVGTDQAGWSPVLSVSEWTNRAALDLRQADARLTAALVQVAPAFVDDILIMLLLSKLPFYQDAPARLAARPQE